MKFITNTKPLADALNLGVIPANISAFHAKSTLVGLTGSKDTLRINLEVSQICSEIYVKGSGDSEESPTIYIDSLKFKQLISSLDSSTITIEILDSGVIIYSGQSKFMLGASGTPEDEGLTLLRPNTNSEPGSKITIDQAVWKFLKDKQLYAISVDTHSYPVYTKIWVGDQGDVLIGDFGLSLFTHSKKSNLTTTCLLSDTIVNLLSIVPEGSTFSIVGRSYLIEYTCDAFSYCSQIVPMYEDDEGVGSYNSHIFLNLMTHPDTFITIECQKLNKFLGQAELLSYDSKSTITVQFSKTCLTFKDRSVECSIPLQDSPLPECSLEFALSLLHQVLSKYDSEELNLSVVFNQGQVVGILVWDDVLTTTLAGVR